MLPLRSWPVLLWSFLPSVIFAQQVADSAFMYRSNTPAYAQREGPVVVLDEAHVNFHTLNGRYYAFGKVLAGDGYVLRPGTGPFSRTTLKDAGSW